MQIGIQGRFEDNAELAKGVTDASAKKRRARFCN